MREYVILIFLTVLIIVLITTSVVITIQDNERDRYNKMNIIQKMIMNDENMYCYDLDINKDGYITSADYVLLRNGAENEYWRRNKSNRAIHKR